MLTLTQIRPEISGSRRSGARLRAATGTRNEIGEALGIVSAPGVERRKPPSDDRTFAVLKKHSQDLNLEVRPVARSVVVETVEIPAPHQRLSRTRG